MVEKLNKIEIELHSMCNLKCNFCPNIYRDNHKHKTFLSDKVLEKIYDVVPHMDSLKIVSIEAFNQPILEYSDVERSNRFIAKIKELNNNDIIFRMASNLTKTNEMEYKDLLDVNVSEYYLTRYRLQDPSIIDLVVNLPNIKDFFKVKNHGIYDYYIEFEYNGINKVIHFKDFTPYENKVENFNESNVKLTNRGGIFPEIKSCARKIPCYRRNLVVTYSGKVTGCCDSYCEFPQNIEYTFGDLNNETVEEILNKDITNNFFDRKENPCTLPRVCERCAKAMHNPIIKEDYEKGKIKREPLF